MTKNVKGDFWGKQRGRGSFVTDPVHNPYLFKT